MIYIDQHGPAKLREEVRELHLLSPKTAILVNFQESYINIVKNLYENILLLCNVSIGLFAYANDMAWYLIPHERQYFFLNFFLQLIYQNRM